MTSEGLGEMFESDAADTGVDEGPSGGSRVRRPRSEDPHRFIIELNNAHTSDQ